MCIAKLIFIVERERYSALALCQSSQWRLTMISNTAMSKQQRFLFEVQTGVIIRSIADNPGAGHKALWENFPIIDEAFYAAERIPDDIDAHGAACIFLEFWYKDNKEEHYARPDWLLRR